MVRHQRNAAAAEVAEFRDKYGNLQHARDTQDEYVQAVQDECDSIKHNTEAYWQHTELEMNEDLVMHQSKILKFNEQSKTFAEKARKFPAHEKQFEVDEAQRLLCEAEWKQKENNVWLQELQCIQQLNRWKMAAGNAATPAELPPPPNLPPPPRMEQAVAGTLQVSTTEQQRTKWTSFGDCQRNGVSTVDC